jgi:hypothetical protein
MFAGNFFLTFAETDARKAAHAKKLALNSVELDEHRLKEARMNEQASS